MSRPAPHRTAMPERGSSPRTATPERGKRAARPTRRHPPARRRRDREPRIEAPPVDVAAAAALDAALDEAAGRPAPDRRSFGRLGLPDAALRALDQQGLTRPFAIQSVVLPDALAGRDILARAETGSGKTLAFGLPTLALLHAVPGPASTRNGRVRAVALVPTRELARQVAEALRPIADPLGLTVATVYGGSPIHKQIDRLRRGVDLVVATPGRLVDLINRGAAVLERVEVTVLDEADHLADLGFLPALSTILDATPRTAQRMLFSATLDRQIALLVERYLDNPAIHAIAGAGTSAKKLMTHQVFVVAGHEKAAIAAEIAARPARTLVFVKTKAGADVLAASLVRLGVDAAAIHSDLRQNQRLKVLDAFTAGTTRVLVATDVAARGLHIADVDLVVHYDPPHDHKDYLHRSGRTARAGATGTVVSFAGHHQVRRIARLHEAAGVTAERFDVAPGHEAVRALATSGQPIAPPPAPTGRDRARPGDAPARRPRRQPGGNERPDRGEGPRPKRAKLSGRPAAAKRAARRHPDTGARTGAAPSRRPVEESPAPRHRVAPKRKPRAEVIAKAARRSGRTASGPRAEAAGPDRRNTPPASTGSNGSPQTAGSRLNRAARRAHLQP